MGTFLFKMFPANFTPDVCSGGGETETIDLAVSLNSTEPELIGNLPQFDWCNLGIETRESGKMFNSAEAIGKC